jgi:cytidylate kinase
VVIVGRAGQVILRGRPDILHVKIIAPLALRAQRIARQQNIPIAAARAQVEASDRTRRNYLRRYYNARWDDPELYDLIINTERLTPTASADLICLAVTHCLPAADAGVPTEREPSLE